MVPTLGLPPLLAMLLWQAVLVAAAATWLRMRPGVWARLVRLRSGAQGSHEPLCFVTAALSSRGRTLPLAVHTLKFRTAAEGNISSAVTSRLPCCGVSTPGPQPPLAMLLQQALLVAAAVARLCFRPRVRAPLERLWKTPLCLF